MAELIQAGGNMIQGVAGYEAGKYNRDMANSDAIQEEMAGAAEEGRIREAARAAIGEQVSAQGANGFAMGTGSALDALAQSQVNAAFDGLLARQEAAKRARARRVQGAIAYSEGSNAMVQGMMGAASKAVDWASDKKKGG